MESTIIKSYNAANVIAYAGINDGVFRKIQSNFGRKCKTTFFSDLSIAEWYGKNSVEDTYKRVVKEWMGSVEYITEFCLALAWKAYQHENAENYEMCRYYWSLFKKCEEATYKHYEGDSAATSYIFDTLD